MPFNVRHSTDIWWIAESCVGLFVTLWIAFALGPRATSPGFRLLPVNRQDWLICYLRTLEAAILALLYISVSLPSPDDTQWLVVGCCLYAVMVFSAFAVWLYNSAMGRMAVRSCLTLLCICFGLVSVLAGFRCAC